RRPIGERKLLENAFDGVALFLRLFVASVDHVQQHGRGIELFERRAKRVHQVGRQVANETDGVAHQDLALVRDPQATAGRIERREQLILGEDIAAGEGIQEGRLAGVRVADDGDDRQALLLPTAAARVALARQLRYLLFEFTDALFGAAAIDLEFGL